MRFSPEVMRRLTNREWRGNVRELRNEVMRLAACTPGDVIAEDELWQESAEPARKPEAPPGQRTTLKKAIEELERSMIADALRTTRGNQWQAARMLGLSRQGLINKIKRYALG